MKNLIGKIIYMILLLLFWALIIGGAFVLINSSTVFSVDCDQGLENGVIPGQTYRFDIKRQKLQSVFSFAYSVNVFANTENVPNFKFFNNIDGSELVFGDGDYTEAFEIKKYSDYFLVSLKQDSFEDIIGFDLKNVTINSPFYQYFDQDCFYFAVSTGNDGSTVKVPFRVNFLVQNILIGENGVIFK